MIKNRFFATLAIMSILLMPTVLFAGHEHENDEKELDEQHMSHQENHHKMHHDCNHEHKACGNPLIEEMVKLDGVFREVVSGVALGDGERVHEALMGMHGTMEKTHEGVHSGSVVIRKNADKIEKFVKMDKEFHESLERLAHAAHEGDQQKMLTLTKELLQGCVDCHKEYR